MPDVFEDTVGTYDLTITTSSDWTIHTADMPNGDNSASLSTTLNQNAYNSDETGFCLSNGAGSEVFTVEFWIKVTADTTNRSVAAVRTNGTGFAANDLHWEITLNSSEQIEATWYNTTPTAYLTATTSALSTGWRYVVVSFRHGSSRSLEVWVDTSSAATDGSTSGTATYGSSAVYELYVGSNRSSATNDMTDHMAKLAFYDFELSSGQQSSHYLAMTAA